MEDIRFSQLVSSRLCHDLIAPVGAINSGLELLMEVEDKEEVMALITQSAQAATKRLNYFRTAFGHSAANNFSTIGDIETFIKDFIGVYNIKLIWEVGCFFPNISAWGRFIINMILFLVDAAPYGGTLKLFCSEPDSKAGCERGCDPDSKIPLMTFLMGDEVLTLRPELVETLEGFKTLETLSPKTVQAYLTYRLGESLGLKLVVDQKISGQIKIQCFPVRKDFPLSSSPNPDEEGSSKSSYTP